MDVTIPLRMVSAKSEPYQAYVFWCIACYLLNLHKRYDMLSHTRTKYIHTSIHLSVLVMSIFHDIFYFLEMQTRLSE